MRWGRRHQHRHDGSGTQDLPIRINLICNEGSVLMLPSSILQVGRTPAARKNTSYNRSLFNRRSYVALSNIDEKNMAKIYYDSGIALDSLQDLTLGLIGYGNQGRAHALNLRDSGFTVAVGVREKTAAFDTAVSDGFDPQSIETVSRNCDLLALLLPDEHMHNV